MAPVLPAVVLPLLLHGCEAVQGCLIEAAPLNYEVPATAAAGLAPTFDGADAADEELEVALEQVADGVKGVTDIQFPPGRSDLMVVTRKGGLVEAIPLADSAGERRTMVKLEVLTKSEQGVLGLAFHPRFPEDPRVFVNHSMLSGGDKVTRISSFQADPETLALSDQVVLLEVPQPYANHNAGQLAFGPDGMLYIGLGDGGWANDPKGHGQNAATLLGSMLRVDIDRQDPGKPYAIPEGNPWVGVSDAPTPQTEGAVPGEVWAIGLRNPWRYSFDPAGRMIVADVGQNAWEEVTILSAGDNAGWNTWEANHCFPPEVRDCSAEGFVPAVWEYDHDVGRSITGGYVHTSDAVPGLAGRYIVGDFTAGRMWALALPDSATGKAQATSLGRWPLLISTFGRDADGRVYVGDYEGGRVFRIAAKDGAAKDGAAKDGAAKDGAAKDGGAKGG